MNSIAIFHTKGGVGKSALTVFMADFLSSHYGKNVLLIDLDPQGSSSRTIIGGPKLDHYMAKYLSLPSAILKSVEGEVVDIRESIITRDAISSQRNVRSSYIQPVDVIATDRAAWRKLNDAYSTMPYAEQKALTGRLRDMLEPVKSDYDVILIDFPGSEIPFWTKMGIIAADWWLLPELPDYLSVEDIETAVELVREGEKDGITKILPLGTILTICPHRGSSSYKAAKSALKHLSSERAIPPLFKLDEEILHRPQAQKATDLTAQKARTLVARYGGTTTPFYVGLRKLAKEILNRVNSPVPPEHLPIVGEIRRKILDHFRA